MTNQVNIQPATVSPQLTPRAAHTIQVAKATAERLAPDEATSNLFDMLQEDFGLTVPDSVTPRIDVNVEKATGIVIGEVVDAKTGKVIWQFPPEDVVKLMELSRGSSKSIVDVKA